MFLVLVGCSSEPFSQCSVAQVVRVQDEKVFSGKLTFQGLCEEELAKFRVIPETGKDLIQPTNKTYLQVDGFWWKGRRTGEWFKIPGSGAAWIGKGDAPQKFTQAVEQDGLKIHTRSHLLVKLIGIFRDGVKRPNWVKNEGATRCPVPSPWPALVE